MAENKFVLKELSTYTGKTNILYQKEFESMMKMEILCFVKITVKHEKKHRSSRIWLILAMPDFLARVKRKLLQKSLNADTNHHFL